MSLTYADRRVKTASPALIMVVEDNELERAALADTLEQAGFAVVACSDSTTALERLASLPRPEVILFDLHMPCMTGWEFRLVQRSHAMWRQIPVIAISGDRSPQAVAVDADYYLGKPLTRSVLLEAVQGALTKAERRTKPMFVVAECVDSMLRMNLASTSSSATRALDSLSESLMLARGLAQSLQKRLPSSEVASMLGIVQFMSRAHHAALHIRTLLHAGQS